MDNKELLEQIGKLMDSKQEAEREHTKKIVEDALDINNKVFSTIFKVELGTAKREIAKAVKTGFQDIVTHEKKQDIKIQDHDERITELEAVNLSHKVY